MMLFRFSKCDARDSSLWSQAPKLQLKGNTSACAGQASSPYAMLPIGLSATTCRNYPTPFSYHQTSLKLSETLRRLTSLVGFTSSILPSLFLDSKHPL